METTGCVISLRYCSEMSQMHIRDFMRAYQANQNVRKKCVSSMYTSQDFSS